jgi:hypothetical protein
MYSLPWIYTPPEKLKTRRQVNLNFLLQVTDFMPVLQDDRLGARSIRPDFADTDLHLAQGGARVRTDAFAAALKKGEIWSAKDLKRLRDSLR